MDLSFRISLVTCYELIRKLIGVLILSLVFWSCLPEPLEVTNIPTVKPQIVISSQIVPGQSLLVLLTKSIGALDASNDSDPQELINQIAVNDALVILTGPTSIDTLTFLQNGLYGGIQIPFQDGEQYTLNVKSPSMGEVSATTVVKPQIVFETIEADLYHNGFGDTLAQVTYSINDPVSTNWYMLNVQEVERVDAAENLINPRAFTKLLEDNDFNGGNFSQQFKVFPRDYKSGDTIAVSLSNISQEYFDFMQLRLDNRFSFVEFLGEPVNYPTNVIGGKGFFNLYIPDIKIFILQE
jgi:hypothetical protein